jgi:hypothetical protein
MDAVQMIMVAMRKRVVAVQQWRQDVCEQNSKL